MRDRRWRRGATSPVLRLWGCDVAALFRSRDGYVLRAATTLETESAAGRESMTRPAMSGESVGHGPSLQDMPVASRQRDVLSLSLLFSSMSHSRGRFAAAPRDGGDCVSDAGTLLKALLSRQHWQKYETFCAEYDKAALETAPELRGTYPSKAQYYRWLSGQLKGGVPYPDACRVLECMFPDWTARQLFEPCQSTMDARPGGNTAVANHLFGLPHADVIGVFATRAEFLSKMSAASLFEDASRICAAGLSLNMICQQFPDQRLRRLVEDGTTLRCLFLDPKGDAIRDREREEGQPVGMLSALTEFNIQLLSQGVRDRLSPPARDRIQVAVYDETIRFNILLVDARVGVIQSYLPESRGINSPTFVLERRADEVGLFPTFTHFFDSLWERSKPL